MSPYAPLYQNPVDQAITWLLVAVWITVGLFGARQRFQKSIVSEAYLLAASKALFMLCLVIGGIYLVGLVFLVWLKITSAFWFIWELLFGVSVITVFWIAPLLGVALLCWALVGRRQLNHSPRALRSAACSIAAVVADGLLYYAITLSLAS